MHFDGSLLFPFENWTRREEKQWIGRRAKKKKCDEENGKADKPILSVRNFDGFYLCYEAQTVFDRAQGDFHGTGHRYKN